MAAFETASTISFARKSTSGVTCDVRYAHLSIDSQASAEDDYDPRMHRTPKHRVAPWMAHFNLLRTALGPGMLGMPVAISHSGLLLGSVITVISGMLLIHMYTLLLHNLTKIASQLRIPYIPYRYAFRLAVLRGPPTWARVGRHGPTIIGVFMIMSQIGICTVCVIITSDSLRDVADWSSNNQALLALLPFYLLEVHVMKNITRVTYMGFLGTALNVSGLLLIIWQMFEGPRRHTCLIKPHIGDMFFTFGMCVFNLSALGVILSMDKCLKYPHYLTERFGVLNVSLGIPTALAAAVGALGYWAYDDMEENVLRYLPYDDMISMVAMTLYMISVSISYPLYCYPAIAVMEEMIKFRHNAAPAKATMATIRSVARPMFVVLTFALAYFLPFQTPFVAFVGNLCTSMISLVFPVMMDISLRYGVPDAYGKYHYYLFKDIAILLLGLTSWVFGVYFCGNILYIRFLERLSATTPN